MKGKVFNMIIGITGRSGDGKTTTARIFNKKIPNSIIIHVDDYQVPMLLRSKELVDLYGPEIIENGNLNMDIYLSNLYNFKKIHRITKKRLSTCIMNKINEYKKKYDTIIVEWVRLPELKDIWLDVCNYRIIVKSDNEKSRYEKIIKRDKNSEFILNNMERELKLRDQGNLKYDKYALKYCNPGRVLLLDYQYCLLLYLC